MAYEQENNPFKKIKGGGTKKVCLPASKVRSMSKSERDKVTRGDFAHMNKSIVI